MGSGVSLHRQGQGDLGVGISDGAQRLTEAGGCQRALVAAGGEVGAGVPEAVHRKPR